MIDQGSAYIAGYVDDVELAYNGPLPVIVFGDHTRCLKWVPFVFAVGADGTQLLYPDNRFDVRYFYFALKNLNLKNYGYERHFKYLKEEQLSFHSLPIQHRIASILSAYDDLIENNTRRIAILEEMARRIYEEWFVHFRFPGYEQVRMVESDLGLIPEGWALGKLADFVQLSYGKALKSETRLPGPFPVYGSSGVVGFHSTYLVRGPGIILGRKGNVGSVRWCDTDFYPIDTVYFVETNLPLPYVYFNLQTQNFLNNDAAVPGLNRNQAYSLPFIRPSDEILNAFEKITLPIFQSVRNTKARNTNLRTQRDLLLPKLISGEIDVSTFLEPEAVAA